MLDNKGFDLWADGYDRSVGLSDEDNTYPFAGYKNVLASIYDAIRAGQGKRVLDIGFGTGVLACKLYENGYDIAGIDFSERMIAIAREKMPAARLIQHDFTNGLPAELQNQKYDAIVCTYAIHHLDDTSKIAFLKELQTHLNPEGRIYIGDVAFATWMELEACRAQFSDEWDDEEFYVVAEEIKREIMGARFEKKSHCAGVMIIENIRDTAMDFLELSKSRYSVLHYQNKPVPDELLNKIIEAGVSAPTACNFQPQKIKLLNSDADREKLDRVVPSRYYVPSAFLVCYDKTKCWTRKYDGKISGEIDAAIVTTHMIMEAASLGLGSIWVMYWNPDTMKAEFEIPDQYEPVALLVVGYADKNIDPHREHFIRKSIEEFMF